MASIVVIPLTEEELNVSPVLFNIYPAPDKLPLTIVPEYNDPPLLISIFPEKLPDFARISPCTINEAPSHWM